jgi:hypothetical protein
MATITQTARAFAARKSAACHNATSDGATYRLHGHAIAQWTGPRTLRLDWCGWHTPTTANHLNKVLSACGYRGRRVGYASARDEGQGAFVVDLEAQGGLAAPMVVQPATVPA